MVWKRAGKFRLFSASRVTRRAVALPCRLTIILIVLPTFATAAYSAPAGSFSGGGGLGPIWLVSFAALLSSIALARLFAAHFQRQDSGDIAALWALALIFHFACLYGSRPGGYEAFDALLTGSVAVIVLMTALYSLAGASNMSCDLRNSPGVIETRLVFRLHDSRGNNVHAVIPFLVLPCAIGDPLSPVADLAFAMNYLWGGDAFWPLQYPLAASMFSLASLLAILALTEGCFSARREDDKLDATPDSGTAALNGLINMPILKLRRSSSRSFPSQRSCGRAIPAR